MKKKKHKRINKKALLTALALSIGAAHANPNSLFNLTEFNSYSANDILARCGSDCASKPATTNRASSDDDDEINENDPATLKECKQECKDEFPGKENKKDRKSCIKDCKAEFSE